MPTETEDKLAILEVIARWSDAVNERDWDALAQCFIDDGVWDVGPPFDFRLEGNQAIVDVCTSKIGEQSIVLQTPSATVITLAGDTATARTTMHEFMRSADGAGMQMWGTYYDKLMRTENGWRFRERRFRTALFDAKSPAGDILRHYPAQF